MEQGNGQLSTGFMVLGGGAMVLCCLAPLLLLSFGAAGLAAFIFDNVWWLGLGLAVLAPGVVITRKHRVSHRTTDTIRRGIANE